MLHAAKMDSKAKRREGKGEIERARGSEIKSTFIW
jgi:hypothetical protein